MNRRNLLQAIGLAAGGAAYDRVNGVSYTYGVPQPVPPGWPGEAMRAEPPRLTPACVDRLTELRAAVAELEADVFDYCLTDPGGAL